MAILVNFMVYWRCICIREVLFDLKRVQIYAYKLAACSLDRNSERQQHFFVTPRALRGRRVSRDLRLERGHVDSTIPKERFLLPFWVPFKHPPAKILASLLKGGLTSALLPY